MNRVFIDGQAGTTGLEIHNHLAPRDDIELLKIEHALRKDASAKLDLMEAADVVVLCLPDAAAIESAELAAKVNTRILDASTTHRVAENWVYGLAEFHTEQRQAISGAACVSNPGCYPTGFIPAVAPLVRAGWLPQETRVTINAVSGYSGGGHNMIEAYEARAKSGEQDRWSSRPYGLALAHKHVPEMHRHSGLVNAPLFQPSVGHFYKGMLVSIPLFSDQFTHAVTVADITDLWRDTYADAPFVRVFDPNPEAELDGGFLNPQANNGTNRLDLIAFGSDTQFVLMARLDNLGKGASGAAVQNLNLMLGLDETTGLII